MAKEFFIERELERARELLATDSELRDVLKQVNQDVKEVKPLKGGANERLRMPYVDATPLSVSGWK